MENALEVRGLTKHYRGFTLDGVSFSLPTGCIMGFIGENGAGKSTTIRLMLGLARAEAGSVRLLGEDPAAGGAALSVGAGGVSAAGWGLAALRRRGFGLGASSGCTAVDFLSSSILTLTLLGTFMDARQNGSGTAGRVCRVQLFYSASRNCRPLFPSSAVCGSVDLLPMRSS